MLAWMVVKLLSLLPVTWLTTSPLKSLYTVGFACFWKSFAAAAAAAAAAAGLCYAHLLRLMAKPCCGALCGVHIFMRHTSWKVGQ